MTLSFPEWHARWPDWPGHGRLAGFEALPQRDQDACWDDLAEQCRRWTDAEYLLEQRRYEEWPPPKRHQPVQRSTAATSTRPGVVVVSSTDDPLKAVPPAVYFPALAGIVVPPNGWVSCPMPDHPDEHPSCKVTNTHWRCWSCGARGSIIDLAAALYGITPRGRGYWKLRDLILERLLWAPIHPKGDQ